MSARIYSAGDAEMLIASATIVRTAIEQQSLLVKERPGWTIAYLSNLQLKIDSVSKTYLGIDSAKDLRQASAVFGSIQETALNNLSFLKVQVEEDFKKDAVQQKELLTRLGFKEYYRDASRGGRQALINLLYQMKNNLDAVIRKKLTDAGITNRLLDDLIGAADTLLNARINQNTFKSSRKDVTKEYILAFNDVFNDVISICKIGRKMFKKDKLMAAKFVFSRVIAGLTVKAKTSDVTKKEQVLQGTTLQ